MTTDEVRTERNEPVRRQPVPPTDPLSVRWVGTVPLPIAGPYRPWAHLYAGPDSALWWTVRLWERGQAAPHVVCVERLRRYARESGLASVLRAIDALVERARSAEAP